MTCPRCDSAKHSFIKTRRIWFCYDCKKQFTVKVGTIMEDSPIGLDKWMSAIWMLANCKNGISSYELGRTLGVRQNSAWFMLHRIREAMRQMSPLSSSVSGGPVESDEVFIGPNPRKMHSKRKAQVQARDGLKGGLCRQDRRPRNAGPRASPSSRQGYAERQARDFAECDSQQRRHPFAKVYTDERSRVRQPEQELHSQGCQSLRMSTCAGRSTRTASRTSGACLKRTLRGTYVAVEPFHLDHYIDEQVFRFNNRATKDNKLTDADRFALLMSQVAGKRLTYAQLTGKDTDSVCHPEAGTGQEEQPF